MRLHKTDINEFITEMQSENPIFWSRFGGRPDFKGAIILEVGCGRGSLCVEMALHGATKVVGIDINQMRIHFCNQNLEQNYPHLRDIITFTDVELKHYAGEMFDFIISKNSFEHFLDPDEMLIEMKNRLRPGGFSFIGIAEPYTAPYGDHDRRKTSFSPWGMWGRLLALIPWGHLFMESMIIDMSRRIGKEINSIQDLGLNKLSPSDYKIAFDKAGLPLVEYYTNQSNKKLSRLFSLVKKFPLLEDYFTHNLYCILRK